MGSKNSEAPVAATNEASNSPVISETTDMKSLAKAYANFTIFKFGDSEIRVIDKNGDPWFFAKDVCSVLSIANSRDGIARLDEDEKDVALTDTPGGVQEMAIVSESGMYTLVLRCRDAIKPGTVPHTFRKWVTAEVLPAIRKSGQYSKSSKKTSVDERTPLRDAVNMLVSKKHLMYPEAYAMVHQRFNIDSIEDLTPEQIPLAVEYIHRVVLEGDFIGKQEELPITVKPAISYPITWWNQYKYIFEEFGIEPYSHKVACRLPLKMLYGFSDDSPSAIIHLLRELTEQGYDVSAAKLELHAYRHYLDSLCHKIERVNDIFNGTTNRSAGFRINPPLKLQ